MCPSHTSPTSLIQASIFAGIKCKGKGNSVWVEESNSQSL